MFSALLIGQGDWYSTKCKLIWKLKGTKYSRMYCQLVPKTHRIEGIGFGLLPTPKTFNGTANGRKSSNAEQGESHGVELMEMLCKQLLPTPNASDNRDRGGPKDQSVQRRIRIGKQVGLTQMIDGQLNTHYVEEMMGYPKNYMKRALLHTETQ